MIRLSVPGTLRYRSLVLRVVASSCKLMRAEAEVVQEASHASARETPSIPPNAGAGSACSTSGFALPSTHVLAATDTEFDEQVVSAIGEAFNNIAIHGYAQRTGVVHIEIARTDSGTGIEVCIKDHGVTFDLSMATPRAPSNEPDQLPESGMGLFIIRSFMDSISYRPSTAPDEPNVLRLVKRFAADPKHGPARVEDPRSIAEQTFDGERTRVGK